ncbi:hypothetical protein FAIPA1_190012 [Frankia sp. AiPs1]
MCRPVRARWVPSSPGACESSQVPPTSGTNPIPTSGIASTERSVTMRTSPWADRPSPPPMTTPSMIAMYGLGNRRMRALSRYSADQNASASSGLPASTAARTARMSPPAHRPRSPAPSSRTTVTPGSFAQSASASSSRPTMAVVRALMAFGRFRLSRPTCPRTPSRRTSTSGCGCDVPAPAGVPAAPVVPSVVKPLRGVPIGEEDAESADISGCPPFGSRSWDRGLRVTHDPGAAEAGPAARTDSVHPDGPGLQMVVIGPRR